MYASACCVFVLSTNCRWLSVLIVNTSPLFGTVGAAPVTGMFSEAYPAADAASVWLPVVNTFPPARFAFSASCPSARVVSASV